MDAELVFPVLFLVGLGFALSYVVIKAAVKNGILEADEVRAARAQAQEQ